MKNILLAAIAVLLVAPVLKAQNDILEIMRSDLKTQKIEMMALSMELSEADGEKFWPWYREYSHELEGVNDLRFEALREYASNIEDLSDEKLSEIVDKTFEWEDKRTELRRDYFKKFSKAISLGVATRFYQVEYQLQIFIQAQFAVEIPLVRIHE